MEELKQLLEELVAVQIVDIAMRAEARNLRGADMLSETYLKEAVALVQKNKQAILEALRRTPEAEPEPDAPGQVGNLKKAKQMSLKQKRYDLQKGLF